VVSVVNIILLGQMGMQSWSVEKTILMDFWSRF